MTKRVNRSSTCDSGLPNRLTKGKKAPLTDKLDERKLREYRRLLNTRTRNFVVSKIRGSPDCIEYIVELLHGDTSQSIKWDAADVLGEIADARAVSALTEALKDGYCYVKFHAAKALGKIRDANAVPVLIDTLKDQNPHVRKCAAQALEVMAETGHEARKAIVAALQAFLDTKEFHAEISRNSTLYVDWFGHYDTIIRKIGEAENKEANAAR